MSSDRIIKRIGAIVDEWKMGCSCGAAGECAQCSAGALKNIEQALMGLDLDAQTGKQLGYYERMQPPGRRTLRRS